MQPLWTTPAIIARVCAIGLTKADGSPLSAGDFLYHHTAEGSVAGILKRGLRSSQFQDSVDPEQERTYGDLSVIWFTDCPTDFRDEGRPAQFRARVGDLVACAGEHYDPDQRGEGKHFFFAVENTRRFPRTLSIPVAVLELMPIVPA